MKELSLYQIEQVSGAGLMSMLNGAVMGAVIGASSYLLTVLQTGAANPQALDLDNGYNYANGVFIGVITGGLYGINHTLEETQSMFNNIFNLK